MALTGLDIYKLLPRTNCKKCGFPTCLAFAMALAAKKTSLDKCPDVTEEAKQALESASEPPIRTVTVGTQENKIEIGGETVLFRHEKTFYHPCGLGITLSDATSPEEIDKKFSFFNQLVFDRVGQKVKVEFITLKNDSKDTSKFISVLNKCREKSPQALLILLSESQQTLEEALKIVGSKRPVIGPVTKENSESLTNLAKTYNAVLMVSGVSLEETATITQQISVNGYREIIIDLSDNSLSKTLENLTETRRMSLKKNFRPLGYPTIVFTSGENLYEHLCFASTAISKYASVVILPEPEPWLFLSLVTLRQNIYTDPQKPVTVEPKLYTIGGQPSDKSPVMVTTNFSLTYFTVEPEIINSKIPSWLLVVDTDGLSVLTAWAAEKFTPEKIVEAMKKFNLEGNVSHRKLIIPGYVAVMSGKLNELSGWDIIVGPKEASGIPKFLRSMWQ
ncbi:MAG: acetyl-CoA decarbonylase/synthase complex subunit gamma [Endomicrobiia bacterium]